MTNADYEKTGYLHEPFKLFHLTDHETKLYECHYHDFFKVILFVSGDVDYFIEGVTYRLEPSDIILVGAGEVHRPVIRSAAPYERTILYVSPELLTAYSAKEYSLEACFLKNPETAERFPVLRTSGSSAHKLFDLCKKLENSLSGVEYAADLYSRCLLVQFLIELNRSFLASPSLYIETGSSGQKITEILHYISGHLNDDLSIEALAKKFFISRRYLMHIFKEETGCSIGRYINAKRLFSARDKIRHGMSLTEACFSSGFRHYSTFTRSYYRMFRTTPGAFKKEP